MEEIVKKYINGEDIEGYSVDELENDVNFMKRVIDYTQDKNFYKLCGEDVKSNYDFVKYLILMFRMDIDFIVEVSDHYLENVREEDEDKRFELAIIMGNLTDNKLVKYNVIKEAIYSLKRLQVELFKVKDKGGDSKLGMGFIWFYDTYIHSKIIIDYCARKTIDEIFSEYDIDLEKEIHLRLKDKSKLNELGVNNYMITFISQYDEMLASYLSSHLNLLRDFKNRIIKIINNWDNYNYYEETKLYEEMIKKIEEYFENNNSILNETIMYPIAKRLGVLDKLIMYDNISWELVEMILSDFDKDFEDIISKDFNERIHYNNVRDIMVSVLFGKCRKNKQSTRILKFQDK